MSAAADTVTLAWMPLSADAAFHRDVLAQATAQGVRALHLSHAICHDADDLLDDPARARRVAALAAAARAAGLQVWCWTHEVCKPPAACLRDGKLDFDAPQLWTYLRDKYRRFLTAVLPEIDGLVLTCAETDFLVYHDTHLHSSRARAARTTRLARALDETCRRHGRRLVLRDFVYRQPEVADMAQAIAGCPADMPVMTKSVPHDWHPFYPPNPLLGAVGRREQWMELDFGHEYEGQHLYPYAEVEATLARLRHGFACGVRHFVARLDRATEFRGVSALHTPWGRAELLTLRRFAENPSVSAREIWREWEATQFPGARRALELATQAVQHLLFPKNFWYADHSRLPTYDYAATHLVDGNADRLPIWTGSEEHWRRDQLFRTLPPAWLAQLIDEAEHGRVLARQSAEIIAQSRHPAAEAWREPTQSLLAWMELFARHREVFFRIQFARHHPDAPVPALLDAALTGLEQACDTWEPRLREQRLEQESATAGFPHVLASLQAARAEIVTAARVFP